MKLKSHLPKIITILIAHIVILKLWLKLEKKERKKTHMLISHWFVNPNNWNHLEFINALAIKYDLLSIAFMLFIASLQ